MRGPTEVEGLEVIDLVREQIVVVLPAPCMARRKRIPVHLLHDLPCIIGPAYRFIPRDQVRVSRA